jgi:hypothetical protein
MNTITKPTILLCGDKGIYIPQAFVQSYPTEVWGISEEDADILKEGPEGEYYNEVWSNVLDNAVMQSLIKGLHYTLYQDGDLYIVPSNYEWSDEQDQFVQKGELVYLGELPNAVKILKALGDYSSEAARCGTYIDKSLWAITGASFLDLEGASVSYDTESSLKLSKESLKELPNLKGQFSLWYSEADSKLTLLGPKRQLVYIEARKCDAPDLSKFKKECLEKVQGHSKSSYINLGELSKLLNLLVRIGDEYATTAKLAILKMLQEDEGNLLHVKTHFGSIGRVYAGIMPSKTDNNKILEA